MVAIQSGPVLGFGVSIGIREPQGARTFVLFALPRPARRPPCGLASCLAPAELRAHG